MFKKIRYGIVILNLALSFVTGTANASYKECTFVKTGETGLKASICDVTFTAIPTFTNMCRLDIQSRIYTIRNNAPVPMRLNYIRIQNNDAQPNAASAIVAAPTNSCVVGRSLAPGASCNIQVNLIPLTVGVFNRILQIGINSRQVELDSPAIIAITNNCGPSTVSTTVTSPPFPTSSFQCTILGSSTVTNTGFSVVNGNVCLSPGSSITGFPPGTILNGTGTGQHVGGDPIADTAHAQLGVLYTNLAGQTCTTNLDGQDLAGKTLTPGVYCFTSSAGLGVISPFPPLPLILDAQGNPAAQFIFQIGSTLTTASNTSVLLINGATRDNVFWQIGSSATLGTSTQFQGTIAANASITLTTGVQLLGRALALNGAVTLDTNAVNPNP